MRLLVQQHWATEQEYGSNTGELAGVTSRGPNPPKRRQVCTNCCAADQHSSAPEDRAGCSVTANAKSMRSLRALQGNGPEAQQGTVQNRQGDAIENAFRQEQRICSVGVPPNLLSVHRCSADNEDQLSPHVGPCSESVKSRCSPR